jgi:hypothetical protein
VAVSREAVRDNTLGVIENTPRVFEISFGVLYLIPVNLKFSDAKIGIYR